MDIVTATLDHLEEASQLFDHYRSFYQQASNIETAKTFLRERFHNQDSVIFLAQQEDHVVGFTQLFPSFSSVAMQRVWILNDLFVEADYRNQGVAQALMEAAEAFARDTGAVRITLATQTSNLAAQALYQGRGYTKTEDYVYYALYL